MTVPANYGTEYRTIISINAEALIQSAKILATTTTTITSTITTTTTTITTTTTSTTSSNISILFLSHILYMSL